MRRIITATAVIATAMIVAASALLPSFVSAALDRSLEDTAVHRDGSPAELVLGERPAYLSMLGLYRSDHTEVELSEGIHMTADEAKDAASAAAEAIAPAPDGREKPVATPFLFTGKDEQASSGIIWRCDWTAPDGDAERLWLDDGSGCAVAFSLRTGSTSDTPSSSGYPEPVQATLDYLSRSDPAAIAGVGVQMFAPGERFTTVRTDDSEEAVSDAAAVGDVEYMIALRNEGDPAAEAVAFSLRLHGGRILFD